jgi:hypothetical protein
MNLQQKIIHVNKMLIILNEIEQEEKSEKLWFNRYKLKKQFPRNQELSFRTTQELFDKYNEASKNIAELEQQFEDKLKQLNDAN